MLGLALGCNVSDANSRLWLTLHIRQTTNISHLIWHSSYSHFVNKICLTFMESEIGFSLFYIAQGFFFQGGGAQGSLNHIFFLCHNKTVAFKDPKMVTKYRFSAVQVFKGFFWSNSTCERVGVALSPNLEEGSLKEAQNYVQFALWGFRVAESRNGSVWMISWVAVG